MRMTNIEIKNYAGARAFNLRLDHPITLMCGPNGAGKSSCLEAVRHALTGASTRVSMKKEFHSLVTEGEDSGFASVLWAGGEASIVLPSGAHSISQSIGNVEALHFVFSGARFASMEENLRRQFLFSLMGLKTDGPAVKERLIARKCDAKKVEFVAPMLRAGFDAAQKEVQTKARECKAQWKTIANGETYGSVKAASFKLQKPEVDAEKITTAKADLLKIEEELSNETKRLGDIQGRVRQAAEQAGRLADLREKAGRFARIQDKLNKDEVELKEWTAKVESTRANAGTAPVNPKAPGEFLLRGLASVTDDFLIVARSFPDPFDEELISRAEIHLAEYKKLHGWPHKTVEADPEAVASLPEYERALKLFENSVANGKRDLAAAEAAANALVEIEKAMAANVPTDEEISALKSRIDVLKHGRDNQQAGIRMLEEAQRRANEADEKTAKATSLHLDVQAWDAIADALAPDGIPVEMLAEALNPVNDRLSAQAGEAQWPTVSIGKDMEVTYGGRDYNLISESEKWRADAMIAETVSRISGVNLLVLDRFDVLDLQGREDALYWLDGLAADGQIDSALIFGTLKALPAQLPESFSALWIENGITGAIKEAA